MGKILYNKNNIVEYYKSGMESNLFLYNNDNRIVLFKKFKETFMSYKKRDNLEEYLKLKEKKVKYILNSPLFKDEVKIIDLVYDRNLFIGYTMNLEKDYSINLVRDNNKKIKILKELKEKIIKLNNNNIFIGDFNPKNVLYDYDNGKIKLCDLDNFIINDLDSDMKSIYRIQFEKLYTNIKLLDNYCFNLFTIEYLDNLDPMSIIHSINNKKINYKFYNNPEILNQLTNKSDDYKLKYLIDKQ